MHHIFWPRALELTVPKWVLLSGRKYPECPKNYSPKCLPKPKSSRFLKKKSFYLPLVRAYAYWKGEKNPTLTWSFEQMVKRLKIQVALEKNAPFPLLEGIISSLLHLQFASVPLKVSTNGKYLFPKTVSLETNFFLDYRTRKDLNILNFYIYIGFGK